MNNTKILTKGQFHYCVTDIAIIEVREKLDFYDKHIRGLKFMFRYSMWREWERLVNKFSELLNKSNGMRECLSEKELTECYTIMNQYRLLKSALKRPEILDEEWYWWRGINNG